MIEAWGRGFDKIRTACDSLYSTPMPEYDISDEGIMVFCKPNEKYLLLLKKDRLGIDESILSRFRSDEASSILQIMELIVANGSINNAEARETTGKSKPTITRLLSKMCTVGLIISEGSGPAVRYKKSAQIS
ncbi:MAG: winged helix-turn-helix transcriptional regulator [Clostridia bacterium]|nr:winged helix-turn-helix transcriptional regulator [Clostridia bacterium]